VAEVSGQKEMSDDINWDALEAPGKQAALTGVGADPQKAADAMSLSKVTGAPAIAIAQDPEPFKLQKQIIDTSAALDGNLPMQRYAQSNPMAPQVSADDWGPLRQFSEDLHKLKDGTSEELDGLEQKYGKEDEGITKQFKGGMLEYERGTLGAGKMVTDPLGVTREDDFSKHLEDIENSLKTVPDPKDLIDKFARMGGSMFPSAKWTMGGALAGSVVPGFGTGAGALSAFSVDQGRVAAGNSYIDFRKAGLNPYASWFGAMTFGAVVGGINAIGGESVSKPAQAALTAMARDAITETLAKDAARVAITKAVGEVVRGGTLGGALMGIQKYAQEGINALVLSVSKAGDGTDFETIFNSPEERKRVTSEAVSAMVEGAIMLGTLHMLPVGANLAMDKIHIDQAKTTARQFDKVMEARDATQTFARAPDLIDDFVKQHEMGSIGLDPEVAMRIHKENPGAFSFVPDFQKQVELAQSAGDKLDIDAGKYLAHVGPELHGQIKDDISIDGKLTINETKLLQEANKELPTTQTDGERPKPEPDHVVKAQEALVEHDTLIPEAQEMSPGVEVTDTVKEDMQRQGYAVSDSGHARPDDLREYLKEQEKNAPPPIEVPADITKNPEAAQAHADAAVQVGTMAEGDKKAAALNGVFADAKAAGMTKPEFVLYERRLAEAQKAQDERVWAQAEKEARKRLTSEWKEQTEKMREQVADEYATRPDFKAMENLRSKDPEWKVTPEARDMLKEYAGNRADYPVEFPESMISEKGLHPDEMAELFGFDSGRDLVTRIAQLEAERKETGESFTQLRQRKINEEAESRMAAEHGQLSDNVREIALDAAMNAKRIEVLSGELGALAHLAGIEKPFHDVEIKAAVDRIQNEYPVRKNTVARWQKAAGDFGRKAEMMLLRGKHAEAYLAKQRQMLAVRLLQSAKEDARSIKKFDKSIQPFKTELVVKGVDQAYTDQIQRVLSEAFGEKTLRDMNELARGKPPTLLDFVKEQAGGPGFRQIDPPEFLFDAAWQKKTDRSLKDLTVEQHREVREFMAQMIFHGKDKGRIGKENEAQSIALVRQQAAAQIDALPGKWGGREGILASLRDTKIGGQINSLALQWDASLLRMERLFSWLDHRDSQGIFNKYAYRPMAEGDGVANDLRAKYAKRFKELPNLEKADQRIANDLFLDRDGKPAKMTRQNLIMVMLNMGNKNNMEVLSRGYGIEDPAAIHDFVRQYATEKDWKLVQGVWDIFEDLFPQADKHSREMTGVGLRKVERQPIDTPFGKMDGGYFPLVESLDRLAPHDRASVDPFQGRPLPTRNYTKNRTGKAYPLSMEFSNIGRAINQQIHDIAFGKAVRDARKLLDGREVRMALRESFGQEYVDKIDPWLDHIATNGGKFEPINDSFLLNTSRFLRQNAAMMLVGARPGTAIIHGLGAYANSIQEAGVMDFHRAAVDFMSRSPKNADISSAWVLEQSAFMRNRKRNLDRDLTAALNQTFKTGAQGKFMQVRAIQAQAASFLIANLDQMSAHPTFIAGYRQAIAKGMSHEDAVYHADQIVRNAHGSSGLADLPSIMRGKGWEGEAKGWITLFGTYWNHVYNQLRDRERGLVEGVDEVAKGNMSKGAKLFIVNTAGLMGYLMANAIIHKGVRDDTPEGEKLGADDSLTKFVGHGIAYTFMSTQPLGRDIAYGMSQIGQYRGGIHIGGPLDQSLTTIAKGLNTAYHFNEPDNKKNDYEALAQAPGYALGLGPTLYMTRMAEYFGTPGTKPLSDLTPWEFWRLALDGKQPSTGRKKK
jgi:hypothetical protein